MLRYVAPFAIAALWVHAMAALIVTEVAPAAREARLAEGGLRYEETLRMPEGERRVFMSVWRQPPGSAPLRVGSLSHSVRVRDVTVETQTRLTLDTDAVLPVQGLPVGKTLRAQFSSKAVQGRLVSFSASLRGQGGGPPWGRMAGQVAGDKLSLRAYIFGQEISRIVPFDPNYVLDPGAGALLDLPAPRLGKRWRVRSVDPFTARLKEVWAEVVRRETLTWQGAEQEVYVVTVGSAPAPSTAWVDDLGRVLKQKTGNLFFLLETSPAEAGDDRD
ncbi:MAG TPA: hypothetical protein P5137_11725 [Candidatus Brocadiia bacterium]|nr:hypothetical protein [Candidatus Brocadiia bacterium]